MKKRIVLLGANGSVGRQCLEVLREHASSMELILATCHSHWEQLLDLTRDWKDIQLACTGDPKSCPPPSVLTDLKSLIAFIQEQKPEILFIASAGLTGYTVLHETYASCKKIAIANKESLIMAGCSGLLNEIRKACILLPVDSEHVGIHQLIQGQNSHDIHKVFLTASGGPFYSKPSEEVDWDKISPDQALQHPTWKMGPKVSLDSATMANKGIELLEAHYLFELPPEKLDLLVQPTSFVHAMVEWMDKSCTAHIAPADMRLCIQYALIWPERAHFSLRSFASWHQHPGFPLVPFDPLHLDVIRASYYCMQNRYTTPWLPLAYLALDEIALERFVEGQMKFTTIGKWIFSCLKDLAEKKVMFNEKINPSSILGIYQYVVDVIKKGY